VKPIVTAQIGVGRWGKNILRNMAEIPESKLKWAVDYTPLLLEQVKHHYPQVQTSHHAKDIFEDPEVQAVVIASPAASHFELAKVALLSGKHVFIEKPIVLKLEHLEELNLIAQSKNLIVMEGHLLLYHPAVVAMKAAMQAGKIGELTHLFFRRTALGAIRFHENAMWDFAPHDFSVMYYLNDEEPQQIQSSGGSYFQKAIEEVVFTNVHFKSGIVSHFHESWLSPFKERQVIAVGREAMLVMDELATDGKLKLVKRKAVPNLQASNESEKFKYSDEGFEVLPIGSEEPLRAECQHFLQCVASGKAPRSDYHESKRVLKTLLAAQESISQKGGPIIF
jgi:UDP-2-acetamido-3-amino-2,3-dideoxy-glucuronate N-acetyltransferase